MYSTREKKRLVQNVRDASQGPKEQQFKMLEYPDSLVCILKNEWCQATENDAYSTSR